MFVLDFDIVQLSVMMSRTKYIYIERIYYVVWFPIYSEIRVADYTIGG